MLVPQEISIFCSSDPENGALVTDGNSSFEFKTAKEIHIPKNAQHVYLLCETASIWYSFFNISAEKKKQSFIYVCAWS